MKYATKLETKDLILGKATMNDLDAIYNNFWSSETTAKYMLWKVTKDIQEARERLQKVMEYQKGGLAFFVYQKSDMQAIGIAGMKEIEPGVYEDGGIGLGEKFVGRGYGKQVLTCLLKYLFEELNAQKVICGCFSVNVPSARLMQSCGLKYDHSESFVRPKDGQTFQHDHYVITRQDWLNINK